MKKKNLNDIILLVNILFSILCIGISSMIIYNIWREKKIDKTIGKYSYTGFEESVIPKYKKEIENLLRKDQALNLVKKLDNDYLSSKKLSKDKPYEIIKYLNKFEFISSSPEVLDCDVSKNDSTGIYTYVFTYRTNGSEKKVFLIESQPYVYTISFEQEKIPTVAKNKIIYDKDGINIELNLIESTLQSVKYNAKITNNSNSTIKLNFNDVSSVELHLSDGSYIKLSTVVATKEEDYIIYPNSFYNQELFFSIPMSRQSDISSIIFYDVIVGDEKKTIIIDF